MDPVSGALLGVVFQELNNTIKHYMQPSLTPSSTLRSKLDALAGKVEQLSRKFNAIDERYPEAGAQPETLKLRELLEKANELVQDCGRLRWWSLRRKRRFSKRLAELTASFEKLLTVDFGLGPMMARLMTVQAEVVGMNAKLDRMYMGRKVRAAAAGRRSSGGRRGMRAEIRYERTEKSRCLSISFCWGRCCGGRGGGDDEDDVDGGGDRRGDDHSKMA